MSDLWLLMAHVAVEQRHKHTYTGAAIVPANMMEGASARGSFTVNTGASASDIVGKVFIVHAYDGSRISCAVINDFRTAKGFVKYLPPTCQHCGVATLQRNTADPLTGTSTTLVRCLSAAPLAQSQQSARHRPPATPLLASIRCVRRAPAQRPTHVASTSTRA